MKTCFERAQKANTAERGSVLVIALVILLVLTMMAIAGVQSTSVQERMAGNMRDKDISFQSAEAALRDAELALRNDFAVISVDDCFFPFNGPAPDIESDDPCDHLMHSSFTILADGEKPIFWIHELPPIPEPLESLESDTFYLPDPSLYRITAESAGGTEDALTRLQSIYKR